MNYKYYLALLHINKSVSFRNSYTLLKIMSMKFGIIEFVDLITGLQAEELITSDNKQVENYEITEKGKLYLIKHSDEAREFLFKEYESEREFLEKLLID